MEKPFAVVPLSLGTLSCGNQRSNRPASHLGEVALTGMVWQSTGSSDLWVRGDFGTAKPIDFMSMIWANALPGTTIRLRLGASQADVDGSSAPYDSTALPFISPAITREDGLYSSHLELPSVQTYRWWRIDIGGHTGDFAAASLVLGKTVRSANFYNPGWQMGPEDLGEIEIARNGVVDDTPGMILRTLDFKISWVSEVDWETLWQPLLQYLGKRRVALWCFDPEAGPYRQGRTYMGYVRPQPATGGAIVRKYEMDLSILSII